MNKVTEKNKRVILKTTGLTRIVSCTDILYCCADGSYTQIYINCGETMLVSKPIGKLILELSVSYIIRISKSLLVNVKHIKSIRHKEKKIEMKNGYELAFTITLKELQHEIKQGLNSLD